jgi:hypothetical protein
MTSEDLDAARMPDTFALDNLDGAIAGWAFLHVVDDDVDHLQTAYVID